MLPTTCFSLLALLSLWGYRAGSLVGASPSEGEDSAHPVCFNNCSGHGRCIDYTCECDTGYDGDDCSFCYVDGEDALPILSAGDLNLSSSNFRDTLLEAGSMLVAATSRSCHRCIHLEMEYHLAASALKDNGVVLARIDADVERGLVGDIMGGSEATPQHLPVILLWLATKSSKKAILYDGPHERHAIVEFVQKQMGPSVTKLGSIEEVNNFVANPRHRAIGMPPSEAVTVVGFFSDGSGIEEDEMEDFMEAATGLKNRFDVYFGVVDDAVVCDHFKKLGWILRGSEAVLTRPGLLRVPSLSLWALLEDNISITDWIVRESVPLVGHLSNSNFVQYERTKLPMIILFLDLPAAHSGPGSGSGSRVGGKSGGVLNDELIKELGEVALEHVRIPLYQIKVKAKRGRISCLYADGVAFADSMKTLGLFGSRERLPQVGINTMDGRQLPFPEELPINRETLLHYAAAFLSGRLQSSLDARKAMVVSRPFSTHNTVRRKDKRAPPTEVRGVSEQFKPHDVIMQVTRENFAQTVLDSERDVLLLFHSEECERCSNMIPYYKRVGERFQDLNVASVLIAAMDVTEETPPPELAVTLPTLPAILLLPGNDKGPPFRFFSGVGKVGPLMKWLQKHSSTSFELPVLPHLSEADKPLFRAQVRERQELQSTRTVHGG